MSWVLLPRGLRSPTGLRGGTPELGDGWERCRSLTSAVCVCLCVEISFSTNKAQMRTHVKKPSPRLAPQGCALLLRATGPGADAGGGSGVRGGGVRSRTPLPRSCPSPARPPSGSWGAQNAHGDIARRIGFARPAGSIREVRPLSPLENVLRTDKLQTP